MRLNSFALAFGLLMAGCVAFLTTAYGSHRSLAELLARSTARDHALNTQLLVRKVGALLVDIETGQRGFIITGQPEFLEPYDHARQELQQTYNALQTHLQQSPEAPVSLQGLDQLIRQRVQQVEHNIGRRWTIGDAALKDLASYVAGKQLMDRIRQELGELEETQSRLILQTHLDTLAVQERTTRLAAVLPAVGSALVLGALAALLRERRRRDRAEQALLRGKQRLEIIVAERTEALRAALARIQSFAAELDRSIEAERVRLAREVHDRIGQIGTASKMMVLALRRKLAPQREEMLDELLTMADESITTAREIAAALRPPLLDDFGLAAAIGHYAKSLERQGGLDVLLDVQHDEQLSAEQRNQLFRILQEAATNVLRHAQASTLQINGQAEGQQYRLEIADNGVGPGSVRPDASGLRNMRERAALAGGAFEFGPGPQGGTRIAIVLPLIAMPEEAAA